MSDDLVMANRANNVPRIAGAEPTPPVLTGETIGVVHARGVVEVQRHGDVRLAHESPVHTIRAGGQHHGVLVMRNNESRGDSGHMLTPGHEPVRTLTTSGHQSVVIPYQSEATIAGERPAATLTTRDRLALVVPYATGNGALVASEQPTSTLTQRDKLAVVWSDEDIDACRFRMFALHEIAGAMTLADHVDGTEYVVIGNKRERMAQYGNAVTPPVMAVIVARLLEVLQAQTFTDLFCGAGGSSLGAALAGGELRLGLNHWARAIETHATNFQDADHDCEDVSSLTTAQIRRYPDSDILMASPECFAAGTLITTVRGQVPIEDVVVGELVLTHTGRWRPVVRTQSRHADTVIVRGQGHTPGIEVTPSHRFWLRQSDREWSNVDRQYRRRWQEADWLAVDNAIEAQAFWATPAPTTSARPYDDIEPRQPSAAFGVEPGNAWWLVGRWLADGSLTFGSGRCDVSICCGFHEEAELGDILDRTGIEWKHRALRTAALFYVTDTDARDWLHEHFGHGSREKHLPGWSLALPRHHREALLAGYVSGDGNVGVRRTRVDTVSRRLAVGVRLLAESLGHRAGLYCYEQHSTEIEGRKLTDVAPLWAVAWETAGSARETYQPLGDVHAWSRIRAVEPGRSDVEVFNIEVADDHSYVAEGIVVANCTNHSLAKGSRRRKPQGASLFDDGPGNDDEQDRSRATMWDVVRFAEQKILKGRPYKAIVVENVVDAFKWGANDDGGLFDAWLQAIRALGYEHEIVWLNSMFAHGPGPLVPQSRDRMYVVFWQRGIRAPDLRITPPAWCPFCEKVVEGRQTWKRPGDRLWGRYGPQYFYSCPDCQGVVLPGAAPAASIIDDALPAQVIGERNRPLAPNTRERIRRGLERLANEPFAIRLTHGGAPRPLTLPLVTLTQRHDLSLVMANTENAVPRPAGLLSTPTIRSQGGLAMVMPVAGNTHERTAGNRARRADERPLDTIHGTLDRAIVVPPMGNVDARPAATLPAPTQTTTTRAAIVTQDGQP